MNLPVRIILNSKKDLQQQSKGIEEKSILSNEKQKLDLATQIFINVRIWLTHK